MHITSLLLLLIFGFSSAASDCRHLKKLRLSVFPAQGKICEQLRSSEFCKPSAGDYTLKEGASVNGKPYWVQTSGGRRDRVIFAGTSGSWLNTELKYLGRPLAYFLTAESNGPCPAPGLTWLINIAGYVVPGATVSKIGGETCPCLANTLLVEKSKDCPTADECQRRCKARPSCRYFTYNTGEKKCGLRRYTPRARSFSTGNLSGLKNEPLSSWKSIPNSVYVGKKFERVRSCESCQEKCRQNRKCTVMIFNKNRRQCSLFFGNRPNYRTLELPITNSGISSAFNPKFCA